MTRTHGISLLLARLETVLDTYGARPERWPDDERTALSAFVERDEDAARLFAQGQALERALGITPDVTPPAGLDARILAAAAVLPQQAVASQTRGPNGSRRRSFNRTRIAVDRADRRMWPELALLAASLFLGLLIGVSGQALPALEGVAVIAGNDEAWGVIAGSRSEPDGGPDQEAL